MKIIDKIHNYLQEKALDKAIFELVGPWGYYHINIVDNKVYFDFKKSRVKFLETLEFTLPSCDEIKERAKKKYRKFDDSFIRDIVYSIEFLNKDFIHIDDCKEKDLILVAKDSNIVLSYSAFKKIDIKSEGNVRIRNCSSDDINIDAQTIILENINTKCDDSINLNAEYVEFNGSYTFLKDLNINSKLISFNNTNIMRSENINLNAEMIDTKYTSLKAINKIEINNTNCDEIKEVDAPTIIYNGQNISYSEGIVKPKLIGNLISVLKKIKFQSRRTIGNQVETEMKKYKQNLENSLNNKPITKILKK